MGLEGPTPRPDSGLGADAGPMNDAAVQPGDQLPTVLITSPTSGSSVTSAPLRIEGTSSDDQGVASVFVKVGPNVAVLANTEDNYRHWWIDTQIPGGMFFVEAEARDTKQQASNPDRIALLGPSSGSDDGAPSVQVLAPPDGSAPLHALVLVSGTATDDRAVVSMDVLRNGELLKERFVETDDFFAHWSRLVPLLPGEQNQLTFIARDASGHEGQSTITLTGRAEVDRDAPELAVLAPANGSVISTAVVSVSGTASDEVGIREVKLRVGTLAAGTTELVWTDYVTATTDDGFGTWRADLSIAPGALQVEVRAIDLSGLATSSTLNLVNTFQPVWTDEVAIPLRLRPFTTAPTLRFELDRDGVNEIIAENVQRDIRVLQLDTTSLLTNSLNQIKTSCGTLWQQDSADPKHDCSTTPLGQTYGANWRMTPEYSFVRLLTMTPANVVVDGTSVAGLKGLANALNIGGGFNTILAELLGISKTQEIVGTPAVVKALQDYWLTSHPAVLAGAKLPITLYDAMQDLAPLSTKLGPAGGHPGILDPSFVTRSVVFGPNFKMILVASSNLRWLDGIDLSGDGTRAQKDYIAVVVDTTGATRDDVLEFDFTSPSKFDVQGLVAAPTVDLKMKVLENDAFIPSCTGNACKANKPSTPYDTKYVWSLPHWQLEKLLGGAGHNQYGARSGYRKGYLLNSAVVSCGYDSDPAGWSTFSVILGLGDPPPPQYIWELILEVGQVALHRIGNTTLAEGAADVAFTLRGIPVGLSADDIRTAMRPELQNQRQLLSDKLLGDYRKNNGAVDFYYKRGADNVPYLFFAAAGDPLPGGSYNYSQPGFFADEALTTKLSSTTAGTSGDSTHEKLRLATGETTAYMRDDLNQVYRLRFVTEADPTEIRVFASKKVQ